MESSRRAHWNDVAENSSILKNNHNKYHSRFISAPETDKNSLKHTYSFPYTVLC